MRHARYYTPSGAFSGMGVLAGLGAGLAAGIPLAAAYAYFTLYVPVWSVLNALATMALGALSGGAAGWAMRRQDVRSGRATALVSVAVGLGVLYAAWVVWTFALVRRSYRGASLLLIASHPAALWDFVGELSRRVRLVGWFPWAEHWARWIGEAVCLPLFAVIGGSLGSAGVYCEPCGRWCREEEGVLFARSADEDDVERRFEAKDFAWLAPVEPGAEKRLRVDLKSCAACRATNALSVTEVRAQGARRSPWAAEESYVENLLITAEEAERLRGLGTKLRRG